MTDHKDEHWRTFQKALCDGIWAIAESYFRVRRSEAPPAWRERVYCYELYHQLRCRLGDSFPYVFHGEIDKSGHDHIHRLLGRKGHPNPDFVLHKPGTMDNLVVMEVKSCNNAALDKDLEKLQSFRGKVEYAHAILLIFGPKEPAKAWPDRIDVLWHKEVGRYPAIRSREEWPVDTE